MKQKRIVYFWIGFIVSAAATSWLYWLWRRSRIVTPAPLVISRGESHQPLVKEASVGKAGENARVDKADVPIGQPAELEAINGIGPTTARRLNDAGVFTYEQLGDLSPEQLQEIAGNNRWDPNDWIKQAKELAGQ